MRSVFLLALSLLCFAADAQERRVVGYFAGWSVGRGFRVGDMRGDQLTHLNYAFAKVVDGRIAFIDRKAAIESFQQLRLLKEKYKHLKTMISVGGWADSDRFSDAAVSEESRKEFARSCVQFAVQYGFDGVDIDWEYPGGGGMRKNQDRPEDPKNFTLMLGELRRQLDERGKTDGRKYLLTIAAPASRDAYSKMELAKIQNDLDWINVMTYDMAGEWSERTGFHAALYAADDDPSEKGKQKNVDAVMKGYLAAGVPGEKLVVGIPFYGKGWGGAEEANHGLFQKHGKAPAERGFSYRNLAANYIGKRGTRYWHEQAKMPWIYDPKTGLVICYDDEQSVGLKAQYVLDHKLGGVMFWELSEDDGTLLGTIDRVVKKK